VRSSSGERRAICDDESPERLNTSTRTTTTSHRDAEQHDRGSARRGFVVLPDPIVHRGVEVPAVDTELAMIVLSRHNVNITGRGSQGQDPAT
jgi:hypothetical protein